MSTRQLIYFIIPSFIWGSTWFVIKFQVGDNDPLLSVVLRFAMACSVLFAYCFLTGKKLKFPLTNHIYVAFQGICLFGLNYWLVYLAEEHLNSALVAISFSFLIFINIFFNRLILKSPIKKSVVTGSILGLIGLILLFKNEIEFDLTNKSFIALILCSVSVTLASLGNILSGYNQLRFKMPVIQSNAYGMLYGSLTLFLIAIIKGNEISIDFYPNYVYSLVYLVLFGSVIAFTIYLKLLGEIGADKAGYVSMIVPVIALVISTIFENYNWTVTGGVAVIMILAGNYLALRKKQ